MSTKSPAKLGPKGGQDAAPKPQQVDEAVSDPEPEAEPQPTGNRKPQYDAMEQIKKNNAIQAASAGVGGAPQMAGGRIAPIRQSRILDRPVKEDQKESSLKINIQLDLEVEVDLYARVKGDITIGLM
ncbi:hypothetical protein MMC25_002298 [Agyrium rufum]|nr:hypothetical protein [Agyrium rufum]